MARPLPHITKLVTRGGPSKSQDFMLSNARGTNRYGCTGRLPTRDTEQVRHHRVFANTRDWQVVARTLGARDEDPNLRPGTHNVRARRTSRDLA